MSYAHNPRSKLTRFGNTLPLDDIIGLPQIRPGDELGLFILTCEHDFGSSADVVATKITDDAPEKGEVVAAIFVLTEAKAGGAVNDATKIAKEAAGTTAMTGTVTLAMGDTVYMNHLASVVGAAPVATAADRQFAKGDDIYVYTGAAASRSAGIYRVYLICKKIA